MLRLTNWKLSTALLPPSTALLAPRLSQRRLLDRPWAAICSAIDPRPFSAPHAPALARPGRVGSPPPPLTWRPCGERRTAGVQGLRKGKERGRESEGGRVRAGGKERQRKRSRGGLRARELESVRARAREQNSLRAQELKRA
eukprot:3911368-Pleurochrysis_carterae.AAC.1